MLTSAIVLLDPMAVVPRVIPGRITEAPHGVTTDRVSCDGANRAADDSASKARPASGDGATGNGPQDSTGYRTVVGRFTLGGVTGIIASVRMIRLRRREAWRRQDGAREERR